MSPVHKWKLGSKKDTRKPNPPCTCRLCDGKPVPIARHPPQHLPTASSQELQFHPLSSLLAETVLHLQRSTSGRAWPLQLSGSKEWASEAHIQICFINKTKSRTEGTREKGSRKYLPFQISYPVYLCMQRKSIRRKYCHPVQIP